MTFTLKIELGNDAMQNGRDIAKLLNHLAKHPKLTALAPADTIEGRLIDINGNSVGSWEVK